MRRIVVTTAFIALLIGLTLVFPDRLFNPGHLMEGHDGIEKQCLSCHKPFRGALAIQCASCHKPDEISIKSVNGTKLPKKAGHVLFHRGLPASSCLECHTDHKGRDAKKALRTFRHESLGSDLRATCSTCHDARKPQDKLHDYTKRGCGDCHATDSWRLTRFDHSIIDQRHATRCIDCHKGDVPADRLHASTGTNCATCHGNRAWKPATFNHNRYFRFDSDHQTSCKTCHDEPNDFRQYTCYGCHEHTPSNIASEHIGEGIRNYRNCARCHLSGSDGD